MAYRIEYLCYFVNIRQVVQEILRHKFRTHDLDPDPSTFQSDQFIFGFNYIINQMLVKFTP